MNNTRMSTREWTPSEDLELRDAALEEGKNGSKRHTELRFWETLGENQLLPRDRYPRECWERYKIIVTREMETLRCPDARSPLIVKETDVQPVVGEGDLDEVKAIDEEKQNLKEKLKSPRTKQFSLVFDYSGDEDKDHNRLNNKRKKCHDYDPFESHNGFQREQTSAPQNKSKNRFPQVVRALLSVAELPELCRVLGMEMSGNFILRSIQKSYGKPNAKLLRNHLMTKIFCTEAKTLLGEMKIVMNGLSEDQLYPILDKGLYFFCPVSSATLRSTIFKVLVALVKATILSGPSEVEGLERIGSSARNRFQKWKPFLDRDLFRREMVSLKAFILERYKGIRVLSLDQLNISTMLVNVERNVERDEKEADLFFKEIIGVNDGMNEEADGSKGRKSVQENEFGAEKLLNLHFFSDDDPEDDRLQKTSSRFGERIERVETPMDISYSRKEAGVPSGDLSGKVEVRTGHFSKAEDNLLRRGIQDFGFGCWRVILDKLFVPNGFLRHPTSLKDRARVLGYVSTKKRKRRSSTASLSLFDTDSSS